MTVELNQKLELFFHSLNEEKTYFREPLSKILQAELMVTEEQEGRIIGIAGLIGKWLFLVVKSDYQNQGIGQKLTKRVIQEAKESGYPYIALGVFKSNRRAVHIYQKLRFRKVYSLIMNGKAQHVMAMPLNLRGWFLVTLGLIFLRWLYLVPRLKHKLSSLFILVSLLAV